VCALSENTRTVFSIWPDYGSFELKRVAEFLISITVYIVVLLTGINYSIIAIHNGMAPIKVSVCRNNAKYCSNYRRHNL